MGERLNPKKIKTNTRGNTTPMAGGSELGIRRRRQWGKGPITTREKRARVKPGKELGPRKPTKQKRNSMYNRIFC